MAARKKYKNGFTTGPLLIITGIALLLAFVVFTLGTSSHYFLQKTLITSPTPDPTADWKTYTNNEITLKYPSNVEVKQPNNPNDIVDLQFDESPNCQYCSRIISISKENIASDTSIDQAVDQKYNASGLHAGNDFEPDVIGGESGLISREQTGIPAQSYGQGAFVIHNNKLYTIGLYIWGTSEQHQSFEVFNQILSTFHFTN